MSRRLFPASRRWQVVLALAFLLPLGTLSFVNRATSLHGEDGVRWVEDDGSLRAAGVEPGGPAETAGVAPGDRLVSVDGAPISRVRDLRDHLWGRGGVPCAYLLSRGGRLETRRLVPALDGEENRFFYYLCVVGIVGLGAGCLAAWRLPGEPAAPLLLALSAALYLVLVFSPGGRGGALDWTFYWGDLAGRVLAPPLLVHFVLRVAEGEGGAARRIGRKAALYLPALALLAFTIYLIPLRGALASPDPVAAVGRLDRLEILTLSAYGAGAAVLLLLRLWTSTRSRIRWRLKWLALSAAAGLLPLAVLYGIPLALGIPPGVVGELSVFPICLVPLGFAAALFQERALDLDRTLRGAVRWTLGGAAFSGGALALSWGLGHLPGGRPDAGILGEILLPLALSALVMALLRRPFGRLVDSLLGRTPPGVTHALLEFRSALNGEIDLDHLARNFLGKIRSFFRIDPTLLLVREGAAFEFRKVPAGEGGRDEEADSFRLGESAASELAAKEMVLLGEGEEGRIPEMDPFRRLGCRYLFPLAVGGDLKAALLVGVHRDGSPPGAEELETLAALASQAARSVEGARLYGEIAERIVREEKLRARSQGILEASRIGIVLADGRGIVTQANRAAAEILGPQAREPGPLARLLPRGLLILLDRSSREERAGGSGGRVYRYTLDGADGRTRIVNVTRAPLEGGDGKGRVYTLDDVTEEVGREEKMLRQDHLASVGLLASQVAHEVNTPLTGIASYAQILMSRMSSRLPEMDLLRKIEAQAFRAAGIAGSVLSFSRRREGEPPQVLDPGPVVAECLTLFETHLKGKRIRMSTERAASLPAIRAHRGRLQQAVLNLLMNAAEALPGGGEIRLEMDREGECLRIRVTDNGVGIPPEILPRIFEPFFTARQGGKGTGLGLSVVRQIVDEHRGRIEVESVPGSGSTFTLLLPAGASAAEEVARGA